MNSSWVNRSETGNRTSHLRMVWIIGTEINISRGDRNWKRNSSSGHSFETGRKFIFVDITWDRKQNPHASVHDKLSWDRKRNPWTMSFMLSWDRKRNSSSVHDESFWNRNRNSHLSVRRVLGNPSSNHDDNARDRKRNPSSVHDKGSPLSSLWLLTGEEGWLGACWCWCALRSARQTRLRNFENLNRKIIISTLSWPSKRSKMSQMTVLYKNFH